MAEKDTANTSAPKKRRWYHNVMDAYRVTKRSFPMVPWFMLGGAILGAALVILLGIWGKMNIVIMIIMAIMMALLIPMVILSLLVKKAMYRQIDGTLGAVYGVLSQIRRGWTIEKEPIAANRHQDLLWRIIGRPGIVLITEGPTGRASELSNREERNLKRIMRNVPIHVIHVGNNKGQVKLEDLEKTLRKLPRKLRSNEVPIVTNRISAIAANKGNALPHGIDPTKARISRRALRGN
ncbi:DUF4191 domain-containing protein [Gleimia hominis]|uniref:DUF4191 domain-containing protein n=1 Tax=Gleimia hominis TaxID=595468 RepID=UPI000C804268|nr:DUF4191 domain-containing protein [Gleimia hominis]WIK64975.1 DUF4191 domain-containing protein [Gleimia hominis]